MEVSTPIEISTKDRAAYDATVIDPTTLRDADLRLWALAPPDDDDYPTFLEALVMGEMLSETALRKA